MSNVKWTKDQTEAIFARGANILVNAAAGSGKTAVLTNRIVNRLIPKNDETPIDADRLLVVTFTRAAASEMRERIESGLADALENAEKEKDKNAIRKIKSQIKKMRLAQISTIDAFCQTLVKANFNVLGIDPAFEIMSNSESKAMRYAVFSQLCDELYSENNTEFLDFCKDYCNVGNENALYEIVDEIYTKLSSMSNPNDRMIRFSREYAMDFSDSVWYKDAEKQYDNMADEAIELYLEALTFPNKTPVADKIIATEYEFAKSLKNIPMNRAKETIAGFNFEKLMGAEPESKKLRDSGKDKIKEILAYIPDSDICLDAEGKVISTLADIIIRFSDMLFAEKVRLGKFDFSDIEQLAYKLLTENEDIRTVQQNRFDEILIDEYQDVNELQDELFYLLSKNNNLFMVGDIKQSIYRFRNTDPTIFRDKVESYALDSNAKNRKIILSENFRSRQNVIDAVNDLFSEIMTYSCGDVDYNGEHRLNFGLGKSEKEGKEYIAECVQIDDYDENLYTRDAAEANYIASRIHQMLKDGFLVNDKKPDGAELIPTRRVRPSDFVILSSAVKNLGRVYTEALGRYGINLVCENVGFFNKNEIKIMMSLLSAIENPQNNVPLLAVMRSVVGGFDDEEISQIRICDRYISFADLLAKVAGEDSKIGKKSRRMLDLLATWRDISRRISAEKMIRMLYEETGIYAFFGAGEDEEAQENLRLFADYAKAREAMGKYDVFDFLHYMQDLEEHGEDLPCSSNLGKNDSVRLMTIHKSKGLEMPVVFLTACGKAFNNDYDKKKAVLHKDLGIAVKKKVKDDVEEKSVVAKMITARVKADSNSEEMRKLYVALTRAKDKLIMVSASKIKYESSFRGYAKEVAESSPNWMYQNATIQNVDDAEIDSVVSERIASVPDIDVAEILNFKYNHDAPNLKSKSAVSDFKGVGHKTQIAAQKPKFLQQFEQDKISGAEYGTAIHKIMETLPEKFGTDEAKIKEHIDALVAGGEVKTGIQKLIKPEKIAKFYNSEIGRRICKASEINRETEFEISLKASELYDTNEEEDTLLQGVIDCWFVEDGEIVLLDYKTDRVNDIEEIHQKYDIQLELYKKALEKITKKRVKDKFIYLFSEDIVIQCK